MCEHKIAIEIAVESRVCLELMRASPSARPKRSGFVCAGIERLAVDTVAVLPCMPPAVLQQPARPASSSRYALFPFLPFSYQYFLFWYVLLFLFLFPSPIYPTSSSSNRPTASTTTTKMSEITVRVSS
jgi:hypothetical protein